MPLVVIDGNPYIGFLRLESLDAEFPVMAEWNEARLKEAPCRYYGSYLTDDLVLCGHNYRKTFGMLMSLQVGDKVTFTDVDGNVHYYEVGTKEVLEPTDIEGMINSPWDLSLYTCTYGGRQRVTVRCRRIQK